MAGASSREASRHLNTLFHCGAAGQIGDAELLERFIAGRDQDAEAAFSALVERHGVMVLGVCRRVLGNRDGAEDAFQATFLVLARKAAAIARREELACWLHGVARHAALDARARANRQKAREKRLGAMLPVEPPDQALACELHAVLDEELARLPERHRAVILVCELEGLSRRQAAARLGISEGTLSSRLSRAKLRLRDRLTRRGFALSAAALTSVLTQDARAVVLPPVLVDSTIRIAALVAAGSSVAGVVSTSVANLTEGVLKAMLLAKLKFGFLGLVAVAAVSTGVGVVAQPSSTRRPEDNDRLKAVERKLDKLLEVMGGAGHRMPSLSSDVRRTQAPNVIPGSPGADAPPAPDGAPAPAAGPAVPRPPAPVSPDAVAWFASPHGGPAGRGDPMNRIDVLERRMGEIERRFNELEGRMNKVASYPRNPATQPDDHDPFAPAVPTPASGLVPPPPTRAADLTPPRADESSGEPTAPAPPDAPPERPDTGSPFE
jgi:RNA polymerase sigma factor (sigma-70 family)